MKNLHLVASSIIIIPVAFGYGAAFYTVFPALINVNTSTTDLHNIFRAMMCMYLGLVLIWITGIFKPAWWKTATITNVVFMGGLAIGRMISFILDGIPSLTLVAGFFAETVLAALAYYNWKKYKAR